MVIALPLPQSIPRHGMLVIGISLRALQLCTGQLGCTKEDKRKSGTLSPDDVPGNRFDILVIPFPITAMEFCIQQVAFPVIVIGRDAQQSLECFGHLFEALWREQGVAAIV